MTHAIEYGEPAVKRLRSSTHPVNDKIPKGTCETCGEWVFFDTDGHGGLLAWNRDLRTHHRHQNHTWRADGDER